MNPRITVLLWFLISPNLIWGQTKKNQISIYLAPVYSKTAFTNLASIDIVQNGWFNQLYETQKPKRGILGYYIGGEYFRKINHRFSLGIGLNYSLNGQKSKEFFSINGISDQVLESLPDYGGTFYKLTYKSYEATMGIQWNCKEKGKIKYFISSNLLSNVYFKVESKRYMRNKNTGNIEFGGARSTYFKAVRNSRFSELVQHFNNGMWRVGIYIGGGFYYSIYKDFGIKIEPHFRIYSNLFDTSEGPTIVSGRIYNIGCKMSVKHDF